MAVEGAGVILVREETGIATIEGCSPPTSKMAFAVALRGNKQTMRLGRDREKPQGDSVSHDDDPCATLYTAASEQYIGQSCSQPLAARLMIPHQHPMTNCLSSLHIELSVSPFGKWAVEWRYFCRVLIVSIPPSSAQ